MNVGTFRGRYGVSGATVRVLSSMTHGKVPSGAMLRLLLGFGAWMIDSWASSLHV